jgi:type I restriction enzyme, S subunit
MRKLSLLFGDLLFVRTNGNPDFIGRCAEYREERHAAYASYLIRARLSESMSPTFVCQHFTHPSYRPTVLRAGRTTADYNLSTEGLGKLPLITPPLALQTAFAEQVQRLEALARHLDAAAAKADAMAAGLTAEVFDQSPHKGNGHAGAQAGQ